MNTPQRDSRAQLGLLFVAVMWAANYSIAKYSFAEVDRFVFNALRFVIAAGLLGGIYFHQNKRIPLPKGGWPAILWAGLIANVLYQTAFVVGLSMTSAGNSAVLLSTSPLWTVFFNRYLHKEKIRPIMWAGMAVSLCGVVLIIIGSGKSVEVGGDSIIGDLICLGGAVLWGFSTNLQKPLLVENSPLYVATLMIVVGAVGLSVVAIPAATQMHWASVGWTYWLATFVSGALSIGIANVFWSQGVRQIGPGRTANFANLVPVLAIFISFITLREELHALQLIGAAITIGGVVSTG
ncbi:MAG: DMT family transporter, partial [bacterium]